MIRSVAVTALLLSAAGFAARQDDDDSVVPDAPNRAPAKTEVEMRPYSARVPGMRRAFELVPIRGGTFLLGSPVAEDGRGKGEGPRVEVAIEPFWCARHEVTWDEYHVFMYSLDEDRRAEGGATPPAPGADAVSRPTPPYLPMDFEMGVEGYPAICMTQFAARQYTRWLSMRTGHFYRLPTEAEWEYACRAGTTTAYSFGDDSGELDDHAWYFGNAGDQYQLVGRKKPNPWGLFDMHGNVSEWVLDGFAEGFYGTLEKGARSPVNWTTELYPRVVRGGSWDDDPDDLRSAARGASTPLWSRQDPMLPSSIWFHTDAQFVGFRVVRPLVVPSPEEQARYWEPQVEAVREILARQRADGR